MYRHTHACTKLFGKAKLDYFGVRIKRRPNIIILSAIYHPRFTPSKTAAHLLIEETNSLYKKINSDQVINQASKANNQQNACIVIQSQCRRRILSAFCRPKNTGFYFILRLGH